jgi:hypothetical protein
VSVQAPPTPQTRPRDNETKPQDKPQLPTRIDGEDSFNWSSSDDEALLKAEQQMLEQTPFETPKKVARTEVVNSPGKKSLLQGSARPARGDDLWPLSDDVFATPSTSRKSEVSGLLSPSETPAALPGQVDDSRLGMEPSALAAEALEILRKSGTLVSHQVEAELVELLNKHDLRTQGIAKGRDITRLAVQAKETKVAELQSRIDTLEAERETNRRVISHLKMDIATSPKKATGKSYPPLRRSEV